MKTTFRTAYGPPDVISVRDVPRPEPRGDEVLVRVHAATVNRTDCAALWGKPYVFRFFVGWPRPRVVATGTDFAGEVVAIGPDVSRFAVGDRIMGFNDNNLGSHAEYLCLSTRNAIVAIPEAVSFETAAASMEGAHYAINFINKVPLKAGDKVLVNGATGAIGSAAVALLADMGVDVTAACPAPYHETVAALGAARLIDSGGESLAAQCAPHSFDFVFDAVGKSTFGACRPLLREHGVYISSELGPGGQNPVLALCAPFMRGPKVKFPVPLDIPGSLATVSQLLARGAYRPLIDRRYALEDIREAFAYVASGRKIGNVLMIPTAR